jgi:hypothetical protein
MNPVIHALAELEFMRRITVIDDEKIIHQMMDSNAFEINIKQYLKYYPTATTITFDVCDDSGCWREVVSLFC